MKLAEDLEWRGLIKDKTFSDTAWLNTPRTFYLGADVGSADSLTIGNLAIFMVARRLLEAGWNTVLLVGGATSLIGDPGGKNSERDLVSRDTVEHNKSAIRQQVEKLFAGKKFTLVDNYDWFKDIGYLEFLRDAGKHYSLTELVQRDYIADRMGEHGSGISYAEFSYSLIQGYDFWHLFKNHQVVLQIGGSDQWGNMISGVPLIRKKDAAEAHAFSMPLVINKTTGVKFGKSEDGAVWLDSKKTSVYKFYQFWLNVDDLGVEDYLKIYTFITKDELDSLIAEFKAKPEARSAQKRLAQEVTRIVHGEEALQRVERLSEVIFGSTGADTLTEDECGELQQEVPSMSAKPGDDLLDILVSLELSASKTEARRLLQDGAIKLNDQKCNDQTLPEGVFGNKKFVLVRRGKNKLGLLLA